MKNKLMSMIFIVIVLLAVSGKPAEYKRIFIFKMIAFHRKYEVFCTKEPIGYYKYPQKVNGITIYLTYETDIFFKQSKFDEKIYIFEEFYPSNMWSNNRGEVTRLKKKYSPVIEKNRKRKNYPFGFGKN